MCKRKSIFVDFFAIFKNSFKAIQEVKRNWVRPTERQMQELEFLQKNGNKAKVKYYFKKQYKRTKEVFFEAMILEWFQLETHVHHLLVRH